MIYQFDSRIRYSEVGLDGVLTTHALMNYLQDCSTFQSEDLGVGVEALHEKQLVWMVVSWQIVIERMPLFGERITIATKAIEHEASVARRNFYLLDESGEMIVKANTYWALVDTKTGRLRRITDEVVSMYGTDEPISMDCAPRKIRLPKEEGRRGTAFVVPEELLDGNLHVNNGQYVQVAVRELHRQQRAGYFSGELEQRLRQIRVEYRREAHLGDIMQPVFYEQEQGQLVVLQNEDGEVYASVEFTLT